MNKTPKDRSKYFENLMNQSDLDAYLLLLKKIVKNHVYRDQDHHEFYYDDQIDEIERELGLMERNN